jgi:hypothetical protein
MASKRKPTAPPEPTGNKIELPISDMPEATAKMVLAQANLDGSTVEAAAKKLLNWNCNPKAA